MADLQGKTLLITGASRGIGLAIGVRAARDGANVTIAAKTADPHPKLPGTIYTAAKEIVEAGGKALPVICDQTVWVRAPESGVLRTLVALGAKVTSGQVIALVADPLGSSETAVIAPHHGVVIGRTNLPLVYEGDATFHIARYGRKVSTVEKQVERFHEEHQAASASDPPEDISRAPIA